LETFITEAKAVEMAVGTLALFYPVFLPIGAAAIAYAGHRALHVDWRVLFMQFLTGPGLLHAISCHPV
jgi:hypothetical protein